MCVFSKSILTAKRGGQRNVSVYFKFRFMYIENIRRHIFKVNIGGNLA